MIRPWFNFRLFQRNYFDIEYFAAIRTYIQMNIAYKFEITLEIGFVMKIKEKLTLFIGSSNCSKLDPIISLVFFFKEFL